MKRSDSIGQIAKALAEAQSKFDRILKAQTAAMGKYNYQFADLSDVLDAVRPALNASKIALVQTVEDDQMATYLVHESGEWMACMSPLVEVGESTPQEIGSGLTYSRRYGACLALGVVGETDDDASSAQKARSKPRPASLSPEAKPANNPIIERPNPRMDPMRSETQMALSAKMAEIGHVSTKEMVDFASLTMSMLAKKTIKYADRHEITQSDAEMILAELVRRYPEKTS